MQPDFFFFYISVSANVSKCFSCTSYEYTTDYLCYNVLSPVHALPTDLASPHLTSNSMCPCMCFPLPMPWQKAVKNPLLFSSSISVSTNLPSCQIFVFFLMWPKIGLPLSDFCNVIVSKHFSVKQCLWDFIEFVNLLTIV